MATDPMPTFDGDLDTHRGWRIWNTIMLIGFVFLLIVAVWEHRGWWALFMGMWAFIYGGKVLFAGRECDDKQGGGT